MTQDEMHGRTDDRPDRDLEPLFAEMRRAYNAPPAPPLDAMWGRIERERFGAQWTRGVRSAVRGGRAMWWMGIAAALVVGVGIGRQTSSRSPLVMTTDVPRTAPRAPRAADYDRTTTRYLGQTAALLISLPAEARAGRADQRFVARAAELLTTTRLLLDSPAASDPRVRALLEDVELVLAQVAHLEAQRGGVELELIAQALEQRDLLPRLSSAVAGSAAADD